MGQMDEQELLNMFDQYEPKLTSHHFNRVQEENNPGLRGMGFADEEN